MSSSEENLKTRSKANKPYLLDPALWRTIVLGKLALSIIGSVVVAVVCFRLASKNAETLTQSIQWYCLSGFFALLGLSFCGAIYLMFRKKRLD